MDTRFTAPDEGQNDENNTNKSDAYRRVPSALQTHAKKTALNTFYLVISVP